MILTAHAERRLRERFPDMGEHVLLAHWVAAQGRRATPGQALLIRRRCRRPRIGQQYLVSPGGIVFVTGEEGVVITLFELPRGDAPLTDAERRRLRMRSRLRGADEERRVAERRTCWRRLLDED